jgi:hypothetical protein
LLFVSSHGESPRATHLGKPATRFAPALALTPAAETSGAKEQIA